jgi:hypothetical protein
MSEHSGRIRASDGEREEVAATLRQAMSEGRLTLAEGEERLQRLYATVYRDELPDFTADLPRLDHPMADRLAGSRQRSRRRRGTPGRAGLLLAAVAAGVWAIAGGGPVWLAILLGVFALVSIKHAACEFRPGRSHHRHHRPEAGDPGSRAGDTDHVRAGG